MQDEEAPGPDPAGSERRRGRRSRTLLGGVLIHGPAGLTIECTVRDFSPAGARVRIGGPERTAKPLFLLVHSVDQAFEADITWSRGNEFGLAFKRPLDLQAPDLEIEKTIHRLWLVRRAR